MHATARRGADFRPGRTREPGDSRAQAKERASTPHRGSISRGGGVQPIPALAGIEPYPSPLYSAFIQSAVQLMPLIHPFTHTLTHRRRLAAMQGTDQLVRSNWGSGVGRLLLPPEPHRPILSVDRMVHTKRILARHVGCLVPG